MQQQGPVPYLRPWRALALYIAVGLLWFGIGDGLVQHFSTDAGNRLLSRRMLAYGFVLFSGCYATWLLWCAWRAEKKRAAVSEALMQSEEQLRLALEGSGSGIWDWDLVQRSHTFSPGVALMMRYTGEHFEQDFHLFSRMHACERRMLVRKMRATLDSGEPFIVAARIRCCDGCYRWFEARGSRHLNAQGQVVRFSGILTDISLRRDNEAHLRLAATVVDNTSEGIVVTDAHSTILSTNPAFSQLLGYEPGELLGQRPTAFKSGLHGKDFYEAMWSTLRQTGHWRGEIWNKRKNGEIFPERMSLSAVKDAQGEVTHYVCMFTDISHEKQREQQLEFLAHRDVLTGLYNRTWLEQELVRCVAQAGGQGEKLAVILLNLDRFKDVNDSYGHAVGDKVLCHIAQQVQQVLRPGDSMARMAGDEFVVLARNISGLAQAAEIAQQLIEAAAQPWTSPSGFAVVVSLSAGICCYPEHAQTEACLIQGAHAAVYGARAGKGSSKLWCFFHEDMTAEARERVELEAGLRHALERGYLQLYYQPQIEIASGRVIGCEALVRWMDPEKGMISPVRFIPVAEASGLIGPLGEWVLHEACRQAKAWSDAGLPPLLMAVNVSLHQFLLTDIVECTRQALERSGLSAACLELEITESALASRPDEALGVLRKLKALGLRLAIDDFGTGYSSLEHLKRFPIDLLKIDRGFIRDIPDSADDMAISHAVIAMGQSMGMQVLAEGVETDAQLDFLRQHGCNFYQGYLCSQPVPAEVFAQWLRSIQSLSTPSA